MRMSSKELYESMLAMDDNPVAHAQITAEACGLTPDHWNGPFIERRFDSGGQYEVAVFQKKNDPVAKFFVNIP